MADGVHVVASGGPGGGRGVSTGLVILVAAALVVGVVVGRLTRGGENDGPSRPRAPGADVGPRQFVDGVPVGYAHSREGAVAALLSDGVVLGDPHTLFEPARRARVLGLVATAKYAATFAGTGARALEAARRGPLGRGLSRGAQTIYFATPIAYRVRSYDGSAATIEGWGVSVVGNDQGLAPQATWGTTVTTARWMGGDWKVDSVRSTDGPAPGLARRQPPSPASDFLSRLAGARGLRHAP